MQRASSACLSGCGNGAAASPVGRKYHHTLQTVLFALMSAYAFGQAPPIATPPPTGGGSSSIAEERSSIYSVGDLILVNPQQSTVIFVTVIVLSTSFEYALEKLMALRNRYQRTIVLAAKEETMALSVAHMLILCASFSFPLSAHWHTVLQFVAMCIVYMAFAYFAMMVGVVVVLSRRMAEWRAFEWASLSADAQHDKQQQLFKMVRQVYLSMLPFDIPGSDADLPMDSDERVADPNAVLIFSSVLTVLERRHLKTLTDFTPLTWVGLAFIITLNGFRAVTVASMGLSDDDTRIAQALAFVATGYILLVVIVIVQGLLLRRIYGNMFTRVAEGGGKISRTKRTVEERESDIKVMTRALVFGTVASTMQVLKIAWLGLVWYSSLLVVGIFHVLWSDFSYFALLVYVAAVIPPLVAVHLIPHTLIFSCICAAVGAEFDPQLAKEIVDGHIDVNDMDVHDVEDEEGGGWEGIACSHVDGLTHAEAVRRALDTRKRDEDEPDMPDEWDGPTVSMHETSAEPVTGSPSSIIGVRPESRRFDTRPKRPVFDDTAALRRDAMIL